MRVGVRSLATVVLTLGLVTGAEAQMMATAESISPRSAEVVSTRSLLTRRAQLTISGVELSAALRELQLKSGVPLAFSPTLLPTSPKVSCDCSDLSVAEALDNLLEGTPFRYEEFASQVLVEPVEESSPLVEGLSPRVSVGATNGMNSPTGVLALKRLSPRRTGSIQGQVVDSRTKRPIAGAQVDIPGTGIGMATNPQGRFLLVGVPAGEHTVQAQIIGYAAMTQTVVVSAGEVASLTFELSEQVLALDELVVTGTAGGTKRRAIGNVVETIDVGRVTEQAPVQNVDQLLAQRSPGMMMMPGTGQVGTGSAIRIRGNSSLSLANEPIIYIDGVRMDSDPRRGPSQRGGANVSRLNDINPADIESIEIIKGPAAATLYGTEASNGVIQIITKSGQTGAPQFNVSTSLGTNWMWNPEGRTGLRYMPDPSNPGGVVSYNPYKHARTEGDGPIFGYGLLQSYNVSARGGTDAVRYFASVSNDDDVGIVDWNWNKRLAVRGNLELNFSEKWSVRFGSSYIESRTRLAQGSLVIDPFSNLTWADPRLLDSPTRGWFFAPPEEWGKAESRLDNNRSTTNLELRFQPTSWMTHRLVAGLDMNSEASWMLYPQQPEGAEHFFGQDGLGSKSVTRGERKFVTLDYSGSANFYLGDYSLTPSVGFQYYRSQASSISASGSQFPAVPITTVSGGASRDGGESYTENATAGVYFQQQVGIKDRIFVTGAVRADANSAFGSEFNAAIYPKLSATWTINEEPFWEFDFFDQLRLRMAWGAAGQQPGTIDATRLYTPQIGYKDQSALVPGAYGNPNLKPERGEELEVGFDASVWEGRLSLEYTHYRRSVKDAIVNRPLAPSTGFTGSQVVNIGLLEASGNEFGLRASLLERESFRWEFDSQLSLMQNTIKDLGGLGYIALATQAQHREGYSVGDLFTRRILSAEIDEDGQVLSALCDGGTGPQGVDPGGAPVPCAEAPQVWTGHTQPTWQVGFGNTFTIGENLTFYMRVEGNGGHKQIMLDARPAHNSQITEGAVKGDNPILQATRVYEIDKTGLYNAGFLRLREVSATYLLPEWVPAKIGARNGSIAVGMRNVMMLWTARHGWSTPRDGSIREELGGLTVWDPEVRSTGQASAGYQTVLPPTANATITLRLGF